MPQPQGISPLPKLLVAAALAGAGAGFMLHTHQNQRSAFALQIQNTYTEEGEDEPYQRLHVSFWDDNDTDDGDESQGDIVFEAEEPKEQAKETEEEEELLAANRVRGVGRRKPLTEEEAERLRQWEAQRQERTRFWGKFEVMCPHVDDDEDEDEDEDDEGGSDARAKQHEARTASKLSLRYPPWMRVGEANEVALFTIMGASPQGQQEGVVDMITLLTTMPPVHRMRELYEFHRGMRDEIGKQARIVTPRMRWVVAGRPALGFVCAFTGFGKTLVSTYVVTAYDQRGFVLVFNSVHDAGLPLEQCVTRHKRESDLAFEDVLRSVSFRRATLAPSRSAASLLSPFRPSS